MAWAIIYNIIYTNWWTQEGFTTLNLLKENVNVLLHWEKRFLVLNSVMKLCIIMVANDIWRQTIVICFLSHTAMILSQPSAWCHYEEYFLIICFSWIFWVPLFLFSWLSLCWWLSSVNTDEVKYLNIYKAPLRV